MAGPNMEIFKFGFYMFFPIYMMFKFGDPEWYDTYVQPYKEVLWPPYESTYQPPRTHEGVQSELARMKAERVARAQISQDQLAQRAATGGVNANVDVNIDPRPASETVPQNIAHAAETVAVPPVKSGWSWPGTATSAPSASASRSGTAERLV
ncbi:hypothetical protein IAT40_002683 [Kwoniella sp. CBS 6097]